MTRSPGNLSGDETIPAQHPKEPIRVGVFDSIVTAEKAVDQLFGHGFRSDEITVFCSSKYQERHFGEDLQPPRTATSNQANLENAAAGSTIGGVLGGLTAITGLVTLGGLPVLIAGAMAGTLTGGVVGGLTAAMLSRGVEKEPADFFDQAVSEGKILVAVETEKPERLSLAARIIEDSGATSLPLREG